MRPIAQANFPFFQERVGFNFFPANLIDPGRFRIAVRVSTSTTAPPPAFSTSFQVLAVDMDSQRDLSRSMLKAKLTEQAAANGGTPIGMHEHLSRPFTPAEVETYANHALYASHEHFGAAGLTRTLEGALQPMMVDSPLVKRVVNRVLYYFDEGMGAHT